jgi:hypothetical protein
MPILFFHEKHLKDEMIFDDFRVSENSMKQPQPIHFSFRTYEDPFEFQEWCIQNGFH